MKYELNQMLIFHPDTPHKEPEVVRVMELRKRGHAKLSNGWVVDEDGVAPGTGRMPGGKVEEVPEFEFWFVCCCHYAVSMKIGPDFYRWDLKKPGPFKTYFDEGMVPGEAVDFHFSQMASVI